MKYFFIGFLFTALFSHQVNAQMPGHVPGQLIVHLNPGVKVQKFSERILSVPGGTVSLSHLKVLSEQMNIHLFSFSAALDEKIVLRSIKIQPEVKIAQFNHYISKRLLPNDPSFGQQWDKNNTGQGGGTPDADIDAPEAWNISTGGITSMGDTIVIAIIDGGFDLAHEDIWFFKNYDEIPGNSIDDDGNGYVDDFDGWNAFNNDGDPNDPAGDHGTHVSGIAAAKGNNAIGIAGVNWGARVMPVAGSSGDEATVVAAYSYVMEMRRMYNNTNGAKGAFVVSTNSSFGVDFGLPSNFPIWCAMYDSLGTVGILSAGATANQNIDVDVDSDIPTACSSPHMVSVTNTTNQDDLNGGAAYGATTIDLGAPGTQVFSCLPGDTYGNLTGTSMATPQVAGAIALMYSAACPALIADYKASPGPYALVFRDFMLNGVDTIPSLTGITLTNGRLNLNKMLLNVLDFCSGGSGCYTPFGLGVSNLTDSSATLDWGNISSADSFLVQWRPVGSSSWDSVFSTMNFLDISGLTGCAPYEFQVQSWCPSDTGAWSGIFTFTSEGCCVPPTGLSASNASPVTIDLNWNPVYAANSYNVQYRESGTLPWISLIAASEFLSLSGLDTCTVYEFQVETVCDSGLSGYSATASFTTTGCGVCAEGNYCLSELDASLEWIESVEMGAINNNSGSDNGYGNFTSLSTDLYRAQASSITLTPGFDFGFGGYFWMVWADLNQDEDFDDAGEDLVNSGTTATAITESFSIPVSAMLGPTRMRISIAWFGAGTPCDVSSFGEVEDYCINILDGVGVAEPLSPPSFTISPNPFRDEFTLNATENIESIEVISVTGLRFLNWSGHGSNKIYFSLSELPSGVYFVKAMVNGRSIVKQIVKI